MVSIAVSAVKKCLQGAGNESRFCGAGDNFVRSLTSDEIVAQVQYLFKDRGIDPTKVNVHAPRELANNCV